MKKLLCLAVLLFSAAAVIAGGADFSSKLLPGTVKVSWRLEELVSKVNEAEKFKTIDPAASGIDWKEKCIKRGNAMDIRITITNKSGKPRFLRVLTSAPVPFAKFDWWNGYANANTLKFDPADKILSTWFPTNAALGDKNAFIIGLDPMILCSGVSSGISGKNELMLGLPVYLEPGKSFDANFCAAAVPAKYGYHDVIQAWYDLFPNAYQPPKEIAIETISGEASYMYWHPNSFAGPHQYDMLRRFYGGRGSWEWCYKPWVRAGDWAISDEWTVGWRRYTKERAEQARQKAAERLAPAEANRVAPMWYVNVCWTEWTLFQNKFPGISYTKGGVKRRCWSQDVVYGIYCYGTGYGDLFKKGLTEVPVRFPASRGIGWDSCFAHRQIPASHAGFKNTDPKSFEKGNPMILEAVGISQLLDHTHKQFSGKFRMANAVNFKLVSPFMIGVRTDAGLYEGHPMEDPRRLLRMESMRARLGSPKALVWHKHAIPDRMKWVDWDDMTKAEAQDAYRQIMDNSLFLSFYWGAVPSPRMPSLGVKRIIDNIPVLIDLIRQGWQPSPAVDVPQGILAARYGKGAGAGVVIINPDFKAKNFTVNFPASYWEGKAALVTGEANTQVTSKLTKNGTLVSLSLPARTMVVLRVCGLMKVPAEVTATGEKVVSPGKETFHRFQLKTAAKFTTAAEFARTEKNAPFRVSCEDDVIRFNGNQKIVCNMDSSKWPGDVQATNLLTANLSLVEYPAYATAELEKAELEGLDLAAKTKAGKVFLVAPANNAACKDAAHAVSEWFKYLTWEKYGTAFAALSGTPADDAVVVRLEINPDELKAYQKGRALIEGNTIRIIARSAEDFKPLVNSALCRFDAAYPCYAKLPNDKGLQKIGLAGKVLLPAPAKRPLRPTLFEMMKRVRINSRTGK